MSGPTGWALSSKTRCRGQHCITPPIQPRPRHFVSLWFHLLPAEHGKGACCWLRTQREAGNLKIRHLLGQCSKRYSPSLKDRVVVEFMKAGFWCLCLWHGKRHDLSKASSALGALSHLQQHGRAFPSERSPISVAALHPTVCFIKLLGIQGLCDLNLSVKFS